MNSKKDIMIAKADLCKEQFNITSEKMWLFCLYMYTPGSETYNNGTQSAKKAKYTGSDETLAMTASRMIKTDKVIKAKDAIQAGTEADVAYTVAQYQQDLVDDRNLARVLKQPSAAVSATVAMGRSMGYDKSNDVSKDAPPADLSQEQIEILRQNSIKLHTEAG